MGMQPSGALSWPSLFASSVTLHMSLDLSTLVLFIYKTGFRIDEKHIAPCRDIRKVSCLPHLGCVCLFEAHLAPERTEGSLCLTFTAAQLYQHHPPTA